MNENRYVEFINVIKAYPNPFGKKIKVVDGFELKIEKGAFMGLIGHSGCGKSTVLTMLAGLNEISDGSIVVDGKEIDGSGPDRAVVFQSPCLLPWMTAFENVQLGVKQVYPHASSSDQIQIIEHCLGEVGLLESMHKYPKEMSGGMQQRVGIARAIALKPKVLLLDEPFGRLDSLTRMDLQDVILGILDREKITTVMVTHDVDEAVYMCDQICMMTNGPRAKVGQLMNIDFPRPRNRADLLTSEPFFEYRKELLSFLDRCEEEKKHPTATAQSG